MKKIKTSIFLFWMGVVWAFVLYCSLMNNMKFCFHFVFVILESVFSQHHALLKCFSCSHYKHKKYDQWIIFACCCWLLLCSVFSAVKKTHCTLVAYDLEWETVAFYRAFSFEFPLEWCTYSAIWLLNGWCHMKLLSWHVFCVHHTSVHQLTCMQV